MKATDIKVWDIFIRVFHWSLVTAFAIAYLTEDDFQTIHVYTGYFIGSLLLLRLVWGLIGTKYARFSNFFAKPKAIKKYIKDILLFRAKRYLGHNPAGGAMVIALIISITLTLLFGLLTFGAQEFSGPLAMVGNLVNHWVADGFKELHEFFANFTLVLIVLHVIGVVIASLQHHENLIRSMFTGYKKHNSNQ